MSNATRTLATGPASSDTTKVSRLIRFEQQITMPPLFLRSCFSPSLCLCLFTLHCVCAFSPEGGITGRGCSTKDKVRRPFPLLCCLLLIISFPPAQYTTHLGDADSVLCRKQQPQLLLWQVYYKECETNSYGEGTEKFCYCNFYLCNRAPASSSFYALFLPSLLW